MAKFLRDLLDAEEPLFTTAIRQLEESTGKSGVDTKLIGAITDRAYTAVRALGLNPALSTGQEVYRALLNRARQDADRLAKSLGVTKPDDIHELTPKIKSALEQLTFNRTVFVLKAESFKKVLTEHVPEQLLELHSCESVEALFEACSAQEIAVAIRLTEDSSWHEAYTQALQAVTAEDFEERNQQLVVLDETLYKTVASFFVQRRLHTVVHSKELGVIGLAPSGTKTIPGAALRILPAAIHYMNELKVFSTYFKAHKKDVEFGALVAQTLSTDPGTRSVLAGRRIHWRVIQRYLGKDEAAGGAAGALLQPHVQPEDLYWREAEDLLYDINPDLLFWKGLDFVALNYDGFPVSFNLFDVSGSLTAADTYETRTVYHFRESLWNELFVRYMGYKAVAKTVLAEAMSQIDPDELRAMPRSGKSVSKLRANKSSQNLLVRQRLIDAAEGRLDTVVDEFEHVFNMLAKYEKTVTIFGSARKPQDDSIALGAYDMAARLAKEGFAVITGGGHGVMEAANRGAYEAGGASIGLNILLPREQTLNSYTTENFQFMHFFGRKVAMTLDSSAFIYYPGGFGTFDELFEILALQQTKKIDRRPVILVGSDFWRPFDTAFREVMLDKYHTISYEETELYRIYDNYDDIIAYINESYRRTRNQK